MFCPSTYPCSWSPRRNASRLGASVDGVMGDRYPILLACCAPAPNGHAAIAPPTSVMSSLLLTQSPPGRSRGHDISSHMLRSGGYCAAMDARIPGPKWVPVTAAGSQRPAGASDDNG